MSLLAAMEKLRDSSWENKDEPIVLYPPSSCLRDVPPHACPFAQLCPWCSGGPAQLFVGLHGRPSTPWCNSTVGAIWCLRASRDEWNHTLLTKNQAARIQSYSVARIYHCRNSTYKIVRLLTSQEQAHAAVRSNAGRQAWSCGSSHAQLLMPLDSDAEKGQAVPAPIHRQLRHLLHCQLCHQVLAPRAACCGTSTASSPLESVTPSLCMAHPV